ncbi:Loganic acid O-methyltransferase [Camellia lanceoleosa]|uniref:Loganic acid O-methyltransferase n=1 Tax=Camellia lanceoleosa TaxID=1840588 RepID=A0ACC0IAA0_9ERIC|nr:Loganic acid O-methyltransferase [Camellia lanceoleosa]
MESKAFPMNGGDGTYSYTKNSQYQRTSSDSVKEMIKDAIVDKFDITSLSFSSNTIRIADLGCSVGPNTLIAMQNVLEAMEMKFHSQNVTSEMPEFQLFFSDHTSNDFNRLFSSLPPNRQYFAAGVPGSFHGRLFPKSSLHFVHSSIALHWLSKVPEELLDKFCPAWNKGRIHYTSAPKEVINAYTTQFAKDMETFFNARADEIEMGGMMIVTLPALPNMHDHAHHPVGVLFLALEQSLVDMVKAGSISEGELDSFNLPLYSPSPDEMNQLVEKNGCFSIERMELTNPAAKTDGPSINIPALIMHLRAGFEAVFTKHFGKKIVEELFERTLNKSAEISSQFEASLKNGSQLFLVLKRK